MAIVLPSPRRTGGPRLAQGSPVRHRDARVSDPAEAMTPRWSSRRRSAGAADTSIREPSRLGRPGRRARRADRARPSPCSGPTPRAARSRSRCSTSAVVAGLMSRSRTATRRRRSATRRSAASRRGWARVHPARRRRAHRAWNMAGTIPTVVYYGVGLLKRRGSIRRRRSCAASSAWPSAARGRPRQRSASRSWPSRRWSAPRR